MNKMTALIVVSLLGVSGCKPDIPPNPVPLTKELTGVEAPCEHLTYYGFPQNKENKGTFFICREGYALNYDPERKTAIWTTELLTAENLNKQEQSRDIDDSRADPMLAVVAQSQNNDFLGIGYKKAKFVSSENFKYDDVLYSHTFYLSNAFPIHPDRVEVWKQIEESARSMAKERGEVYVISGPIYQNGLGLGWVGVPDSLQSASRKNSNKGKIQVPTHVFKALIDPKNNQGLAFVMPNSSISETSTPLHTVSLKGLEGLSELIFAPTIERDKEQYLKNQQVN